MGRLSKDHDAAKGRIRKLHQGAIANSLREAICTAGSRKLNADEQRLFVSFVDELERRSRDRARRLFLGR